MHILDAKHNSLHSTHRALGVQHSSLHSIIRALVDGSTLHHDIHSPRSILHMGDQHRHDQSALLHMVLRLKLGGEAQLEQHRLAALQYRTHMAHALCEEQYDHQGELMEQYEV